MLTKFVRRHRKYNEGLQYVVAIINILKTNDQRRKEKLNRILRNKWSSQQ